MSEGLYHYSIFRYAPRPQRGEFVNFGVVVVGDANDETAVEFTADWRRARALGQAEDVALLRRLARQWQRQLKTSEVEGSQRLFVDGTFGHAWLAGLHAESANLVQLSEPRRALAESAGQLARAVFHDFVGEERRRPPRESASKRGLQLALEGQLRQGGLGNAFERKYPTPGRTVHDWVFDYAIKNGRPLHLVQTLSFKVDDVKSVLSEATYVAFAKRDIGQSETFARVPVSVLAEPPRDGQDIVDETRSILAQDDVALILRPQMHELVGRLQTVVASPRA